MELEAREIFNGTGVNITIEGRKYLGGYVGTKEGREKYVRELVDDWVSQLEVLSEIARSEPQAAYCGFTAGFKHKLTYFIRTMPDLVEILKPVDEIINNKLLPAITERSAISDDDRHLFSLPAKMGGLGLPIYAETSTIEYNNSRRITENLSSNIVSQEREYVIDEEAEKAKARAQKKEKEDRNEKILDGLRQKMTPEKVRANDLAQLKGGSMWLTSLPLKTEGFAFNKRYFFDALALRYRWSLKYLPNHCHCGKPFTMDHAMQCMYGGYVIRRHDRIRDLFAKLLREVAYGVEVEPRLQPLTGEVLAKGTCTSDEARLDFAGKSFWQPCEMAFFDVNVFSPFAKSHVKTNLDTLFRRQEEKKKEKYNDRVIKIEHGSFTPVVMSAFGGFGRESSCFVSKLVEKIAEKQGTERSVVANYVRSKISFELVRSQVECIRGSRSKKSMPLDPKEMEVVNSATEIRE